MAADGRGIPLDEYTKATPPGWKPHMQDYSLRLYLEKLRLWLRTTDIGTGDPAKVGPTVVGRLRGAAYRCHEDENSKTRRPHSRWRRSDSCPV